MSIESFEYLQVETPTRVAQHAAIGVATEAEVRPLGSREPHLLTQLAHRRSGLLCSRAPLRTTQDAKQGQLLEGGHTWS